MRIFQYIIISLILIGCECVPGINTDKIKEPSDYSHLNVFNGIYDVVSVKISSDGFILYDDLGRYEISNDYKKFPYNESGYLSVTDNDNSFRFLNLPLNFKKDDYYSLFLYGSVNYPKYKLLSDKDLTGKIRFLNLTDADLEINLNDNINLIANNDYEIFDAKSINKVQIILNSEIIKEINVDINDNITNIIILNTKIEPITVLLRTKNVS